MVRFPFERCSPARIENPFHAIRWLDSDLERVLYGMQDVGLRFDVSLMALCYGYVLLMIFVSDRLGEHPNISRKASRKFLHAMIGDLLFVIPFFSRGFAPFMVAAPFMAVTFLASPYSPFQGLRDGLGGLSSLTEEGHHAGLILCSVSCSILALHLARMGGWTIVDANRSEEDVEAQIQTSLHRVNRS